MSSKKNVDKKKKEEKDEEKKKKLKILHYIKMIMFLKYR